MGGSKEIETVVGPEIGARPPFTGQRDAGADPSGPTPRRARGRRGPARMVDIAVAIALAVASAVLSAIHVSEHRSYSQFDEYVYIDYYARVLDEGIVRQGSDTEDFARRYISCHVNRVFGPWQPQLCPVGKSRPSAQYPLAGLSTADLYPPIYFYSIRIAAQPLVWAGVGLVQAGRYATSLWLMLAVILLYAGLRRMGSGIALSASACLVMMSSVGAYFSSTYISTDATTLPAGAAMLLLAQLYLERSSRTRVTVILLVAAVAGLLKVQNLEAVAVFSLILGFAAFRAAGAAGKTRWRAVSRDHRVLMAVAAVGVAGAAQVVWLAIRAKLAIGPSADFGISRGYQIPGDLVSNLISFMVSAPQIGAANQGNLGVTALNSAYTLSLLVPAGVLGLCFAAQVEPWRRHLGWAVLIASMVSGPVLSVATVVASGTYTPLAERYGLALLPAMLACLVFLVAQDSRAARIVGLLVGLGFFAAGLTFVG